MQKSKIKLMGFAAYLSVLLGFAEVQAQTPSAPPTPAAPATPAELQAPPTTLQRLPLQGVQDHQLNRRVHEQLRNVRIYEPTNFTIFSQSGFVTIQGRARNSDEANAVIEEARKVSGVNNVINHIIIDPNM